MALKLWSPGNGKQAEIAKRTVSKKIKRKLEHIVNSTKFIHVKRHTEKHFLSDFFRQPVYKHPFFYNPVY